MEKTVSVRAQVRKTAFALAAVAALAGAAGRAELTSRRLEAARVLQNEGRLGELGASLEAISQTLGKAYYAGTPGLLHTLSAQALAETAAAKVHLAGISSAGSELDAVNRFLSQAGNYALSLSQRRAAGEPLTQEDAEALSALTACARALSDAVARLEQGVSDGETAFDDAAQFPPDEGESMFAELSALDGYPALSYDGAYADILPQARGALQTPAEVSESEARRAAEALAGRVFRESGKLDGQLPCFAFFDEDCTVTIARYGGKICTLSCAREAGEGAISRAEAQSAAQGFLSRAGYDSMRPVGTRLSGGEYFAAFAHEEQGVLCLPDEIRVGVAPDTGEIVWFDASAYLQSHCERVLLPPALTPQEGLASLGGIVQNAAFSARVLLPTPGGLEADCYEYSAEGRLGEKLLLYVDTQTGEEREIRFAG